MPVPAPPTASALVIGGPLRAVIGVGLWLVALVLVLGAGPLEFGIGWTALVPAFTLSMPATALLRRRSLTITGTTLEVVDGWLWRRAMTIALIGSEQPEAARGAERSGKVLWEVEVIPTAGLRAVVLHRQSRSWPVATWVAGSTADRLVEWLGTHGVAQRTHVAPVNDR